MNWKPMQGVTLWVGIFSTPMFKCRTGGERKLRDGGMDEFTPKTNNDYGDKITVC